MQNKDNYLSNLLNAIIDNLQVSFEKIHLRYEDNTNQKFGVGVTLGELSAVSCNEEWKPPALDSKDKNLVYKLIQMNYFGIYCETNAISYNTGTSIEKNARFLHQIVTKDSNTRPVQYILDPVTAVGKLTWSKVFEKDIPIYEFLVDLDQISLNLDNEQYQIFINVMDDISRSALSYEFRRFRPPRSITVKMDPKGWFKYAGKCVIDVIHKKRYQWSWESMSKRRDQRKRYINLYQKLRDETILLNVK